MLFFIPLLVVTALLQAIIPGVPTPGTFVTIDAAARGTDVSLWILQQCPSTATTLAELELALQLGSSDPLVYSVPLGLHVWRSFPSVRAWGRTLVTSVDRLLSTSGVRLNAPRRPTRHARVPRLEALPNGTAPGWRTCNDGPGRSSRVCLALAMAQIGLPLPTLLTLPAPALVLSLPAPRPILALPAPAPVLGLPAPEPVASITIPGTTLISPTPTSTHALPAPKPVFTQPPAKASPASEIVPTTSASTFEEHVSPSPGPVPFCARPTLAATMAPSRPASKTSGTLSAPTRGFYPVPTKPTAYNTIRKWRSHFSFACLVVLTLGFHLAASRLLEGFVWHLVGECGLDNETTGEHDGLGTPLDPFSEMAIDIFSPERPGILTGLAPDMLRFCGQPEPVGTVSEDEISGEREELEHTLDPFDRLAVDVSDVVRSGRLGGLAPDLFRFCDQPELPDAALEDALDEPLGPVETIEGNAGEDTQEDMPTPEDGSPCGSLETDPKPVGTEVVEESGALGDEVGVETQDEEQSVDTVADQPAGSVDSSSGSPGDPFSREGFAWSDEALANDTTSTAGMIGRIEDLLSELKRGPRQPKPGPSNPEAKRECGEQHAQVGGSGTSSGRWAPQSEGGWRGGYRGGQGSGTQNSGWNRGGGRGGAYGGAGSGRHSGGRGGYSGGRGEYGNGGNGGGSYRGGGERDAGRDGRNGSRREAKATYFVRLRQERKAAREAAEN